MTEDDDDLLMEVRKLNREVQALREQSLDYALKAAEVLTAEEALIRALRDLLASLDGELHDLLTTWTIEGPAPFPSTMKRIPAMVETVDKLMKAREKLVAATKE